MRKLITALITASYLLIPSSAFSLSELQRDHYNRLNESQKVSLAKLMDANARCAFLYLSANGMQYLTTISQLHEMGSRFSGSKKLVAETAILNIERKTDHNIYRYGLERALSIYKKEYSDSIQMLRSEATYRLNNENCAFYYINATKSDKGIKGW